MRDEHMIVQQGKQYVLYAGLLDKAHGMGLRSIDTDLIQIPSDENGNVAIVKAEVELMGAKHGDTTYHQKFKGIGDASPQNVGRNVAPHLIRMAETRAKARALRDAVNVGVTAFEETDGGEGSPQESPAPADSERTPGGASKKAAGKLWHLVGGREGAHEWQDKNGNIKDMSAKQVSDHINKLS